MLSIAYLLLFLAGGVLITRWQLPRLRRSVRIYTGLGAGWLLYLWLPALWAYAVSFSAAGHLLALLTMALLCLAAWLLRDRRPARGFTGEEKRGLLILLLCVLPLLALSIGLEYTHTIRPAANGSLHVGQSTYGDLQLHLAIASSAVNAKFPLHNSLLLGATMAYPYLSDTAASSMMVMGMPLGPAMVISAGFMLFMVYTGYALLAWQLCRRKGAAPLALFLLFLNGGLGIWYVLDSTQVTGSWTTLTDRLKTVMDGYYQTPTNQPTPYNLRWVNLICDMLIPQRGILGGWSVLMPALNLLLPSLCLRTEGPGLTLCGDDAEERGSNLRLWILLGVLGGGLPLLHTHSYLALVLASAGMCLYCLLHTPKGELGKRLRPWLVYAGIAALLSVPQLVCFTFRQTSSSNHFLRLWFNWANNTSGSFTDPEFIDQYFWFYLKNIGVPLLLILFALLRHRSAGYGSSVRYYAMNVVLPGLLCSVALLLLVPADSGLYAYLTCRPILVFILFAPQIMLLPRAYLQRGCADPLPEDLEPEGPAITQNRMIACGAFLILLAAECVKFQPNIYDNNKLIYVWFLLCLPMAADWAMEVWEKLKAVPGRRVIAGLFLFLCFSASGLTILRECVSDYEAYNAQDVAAAEYIRENTPEHSVFVTGTQHLDPVSSLAGRTIVCGPDLYLYFHGFSTGEVQSEVAAFYADPASNLDFLKKYGVDYIYVSAWERNSYDLDEETIESLFPLVFESAGGYNRVFSVPEEYRR